MPCYERQPAPMQAYGDPPFSICEVTEWSYPEFVAHVVILRPTLQAKISPSRTVLGLQGQDLGERARPTLVHSATRPSECQSSSRIRYQLGSPTTG